jgi:hypothetical protein
MTENARPKEPPEAAAPSRSRRALLKAGWVAPMVVVLSLPAVSFEANASNGRVGRIQPSPVGTPRITPPTQPPWFWPPFLPWPPFRR